MGQAGRPRKYPMPLKPGAYQLWCIDEHAHVRNLGVVTTDDRLLLGEISEARCARFVKGHGIRAVPLPPYYVGNGTGH